MQRRWGLTISILFLVLTVYLILAYSILRKTLLRCIGREKGKGARSALSKMFLVFVIDYFLTATYLVFFGYYYELVCSTFYRFLLSDILQMLLDYPNILAVCWLHIKNS